MVLYKTQFLRCEMKTLTIIRPDDFYVHSRQGDLLRTVLPFTANIFGRAVIMGNLAVPVVTAEQVENYRSEILSSGVRPSFNPIMSVMLVMLVNGMTPEMLAGAQGAGARVLKFIPGGTSTNSNEGVPLTELKNYYPVLAKAHELGMIFSGHFELIADPETGKNIPELEREERAIPFLEAMVREFPDLKIVVEHVTTGRMVRLVKDSPVNVAATITAHHLLLEARDVIDGEGQIINPLNYCKPIAKTKEDREAVIKAAISGNPKFFFGSDFAPHPILAKRKIPPAAEIFSAPVALSLLAKVFEARGALGGLEDFSSRFGAQFYGLPLNPGTITLEKRDWLVPESVGGIPIFLRGEILEWRVVD